MTHTDPNPNDAIQARGIPLSRGEKILKEKFYEDIAAQSDRMDRLGHRLVTLELAIPGLYAAAFRLAKGRDATLCVGPAVWMAFGLWFLALVATLWALFPKKWLVDERFMKKKPTAKNPKIGIRDFFGLSALHKRRFLMASCLFFFGGIFFAFLAIFF
ncbi:conserved membrane hypothetical protein [Candidatus Desulfarcum epimagneticum]|uniref:Uncharacterized protein n=1 Tax=uncultured Desulfobacteraceae bacterium TaxID=218296 RepID=A0A484HM97_9BACT|nr:conserved membrane hypothetical protein [uncultured Desulfobacteraceae bacterium]